MNNVVSFLNNRYLVAVLVGLFLVGIVRRFVAR